MEWRSTAAMDEEGPPAPPPLKVGDVIPKK